MRFPSGALRPNLVGNPELPSRERTLNHWFNTAAFVNPANFTFGNSPRSVLRGPGLATLDANGGEDDRAWRGDEVRRSRRGVQRSEPRELQHSGFTLGAADFGVISSARPASDIQLGARLSF
jgi:hypothetical protein